MFTTVILTNTMECIVRRNEWNLLMGFDSGFIINDIRNDVSYFLRDNNTVINSL